MTSRRADDESARDPFRLLEEAGRLGASLAGRIAEDFRRLAIDGNATTGHAGRANSSAADELRSNLRTAQLDLERAAGEALTLLGSATDIYAGWADSAVEALSATGEGGCPTLTVESRPGTIATANLWVHNTTAGPSGRLRIHVSPLITSSGEASTIRVDVEPSLDIVEAGSSIGVLVTVAVDDGTPAGEHHGLILLHDLPDSVVHLRVDVGGADPS